VNLKAYSFTLLF